MAITLDKDTLEESVDDNTRVIPGDDPVGFAIIRRYCVGLEARAMDLYSTDRDTLDRVSSVLGDALTLLYKTKPKKNGGKTKLEGRGGRKKLIDCNDARYEACDDVCVPRGCCPSGRRRLGNGGSSIRRG